MKAKVKTTSNYRDLNDQWLEVKEIVGTRVSCIVDTPEYGKQTVDFKLSEVDELDFQKPVITLKQVKDCGFYPTSNVPVEINISKECWTQCMYSNGNVTVS